MAELPAQERFVSAIGTIKPSETIRDLYPLSHSVHAAGAKTAEALY